jgi:hypothetical protein
MRNMQRTIQVTRQGKAPIIRNLILSKAAPVGMYDFMELQFDIDGDPQPNPFEPFDGIRGVTVDVYWTAPSGTKKMMPAFWWQDYAKSGGVTGNELYTASGSPHWKARFMVEEVGTYKAEVVSTTAAGTVRSTITCTTTTSALLGPPVVHQNNPICLARKASPTVQWFPVGNNVAHDSDGAVPDGSVDWNQSLDEIANNGGNIARHWGQFSYNTTTIEWSAQATLHNAYPNTFRGLGYYNLAMAYREEQFMEGAKSRGVVAQFVLIAHGDWQADEGVGKDSSFNTTDNNAKPSPYSDDATPPGPLPAHAPEQWATDGTVQKYLDRKFRYVIARWGAYYNIIWEIGNELGSSGRPAASQDGYGSSTVRSQYIAHFSRLARLIKSLDPHEHLVTWSQVWGQATTNFEALIPDLDIQENFHRYADKVTDVAGGSYALTHGKYCAYYQQNFNIPACIGEYGLQRVAPYEVGCDITKIGTTYTQAQMDHLQQGTHYHNVMWLAGMLHSWPMYWWWNQYLDATGTARPVGDATKGWPLQPVHIPFYNMFFNEDAGDLTPTFVGDATLAAGTSKTAGIEAYALRGTSRFWAWVLDTLNQYDQARAATANAAPGNLAGRNITGQTFTLAGMTNGAWLVQPYATWSPGGKTGNQFLVLASAGSCTVAVPSFQRDVAFKAVLPTVGDTFTRSATNSWGTAETGLAWTIDTTTTAFQVAGGAATMSAVANATRRAWQAVSIADAESLVKFRIDKLPIGGNYTLYSTLRQTALDGDYYRAVAAITPTGQLFMSIDKVTSGGGTVNIVAFTQKVGMTMAAVTDYLFKFQVKGTTVQSKLWAASTSEPSAFDRSTTDGTITAAGGTGLRGFAASAVTNGPILATIDEYSVVGV